METVLGSGFLTLPTIRKEVTAHLDTLMGSDSSFWADAEFIFNGSYDAAIDAHLKKCALMVVPEPGHEASIAQGLAAMRVLCAGDMVQAQDPTLVKQLNGAANIFQVVLEHRGPSARDAGKWCAFSRVFLKQVENYMTFIVSAVDDSQFDDGTVLFGANAMIQLVKMMKDKGEGAAQEPSHLRTLRSFRWMVSDEESSLFEVWMKQSLSTERDRMLTKQREALKDIDEGVGLGDSNAASCSVVCAPPLTQKAKRSESPQAVVQDKIVPRTEEDALEEENANGLLNFFGARAL